MTTYEEFKPLGNRVLLKRLEKNNEKGGILLPESHLGKQLHYKVLAVSDKVDGLKKGNEVVAPPDGGQKITLRGHGECEVLESRRIMAIVK